MSICAAYRQTLSANWTWSNSAQPSPALVILNEVKDDKGGQVGRDV